MDPFYLASFESQAPRYHAPQEQILDFLQKRNSEINPKYLARFGVKPHQVRQRFFECPDIFLPIEEMPIYGSPVADMQKRTLFYSERVNEIFKKFYIGTQKEPEHIIHVTCTGYVSPSPPQKLISLKQWQTEITHLYHMGCYAALPAIRMAWGQSHFGKRIDLVHTEICSLHLNTFESTPEQIVVQTLFADGHMKYTGSKVRPDSGFLVLGIKEKVLPDSESDMTWMPASWGMKMALSREVPKKIAAVAKEFTINLIQSSGLSVSDTFKNGIFALHPGGPKIIEILAQTLELSDEQTWASREILFNRGNMSSATLPHIWQKILESKPKPGTPIISLGFGPGLTIIGSVFEVC